MAIIEKAGNEVTTFFVDSSRSPKVETKGVNNKKENFDFQIDVSIDDSKGEAETFFINSLNKQKETGPISNAELDDLVIDYRESPNDDKLSQILGQILMRTTLLKNKDKYVKDSWLPFAEHEDYEQQILLGLIVTIKQYDKEKGHFASYCYKYCNGRMSDLNRRSYNGGRSFGNYRTKSNTDPESLTAVTNKMFVSDMDDYDVSATENLDKIIMRQDITQIICETVSETAAEIIFMNVIDGVPMREVAEILGMSKSTADSKKEKALKKLRKCHPELKSYLRSYGTGSDDISIFKKANFED